MKREEIKQKYLEKEKKNEEKRKRFEQQRLEDQKQREEYSKQKALEVQKILSKNEELIKKKLDDYNEKQQQ